METTNTAPRTALLPFDACECSEPACPCAKAPCPAHVLVRRDGATMAAVCGNCDLPADVEVARVNASVETVEVAPLPLICPDCHGERGGIVIVGMADEEWAECEACDGAGDASCQICGDAPAVSVLLTSEFRELVCVGCGAVDAADGKAVA